MSHRDIFWGEADCRCGTRFDGQGRLHGELTWYRTNDNNYLGIIIFQFLNYLVLPCQFEE